MTRAEAKKYIKQNSKRTWRGCRVWTGRLDYNGYGRCTHTIPGSSVAHRASYWASVGELVPGQEIDHLCSNRACIKPKHLEQVTPNENDRRRRRTHCRRGHEYAVTGEYITFNPDGVTYRGHGCKPCLEVSRKARQMKAQA